MIETLKKIYAALMAIETHGESTVLMGQCLQALNDIVKNFDTSETKIEKKE